MKSAIFVAVLFVCLTVAMAMSTKRCQKILPKVQAKLTLITDMSGPDMCSGNESCQTTSTKMKGDCAITKTVDYSGCSAEEGRMTIYTSNNCTLAQSTTTKPCKIEKKQNKREYLKQFLKYKVEKLQRCADGCSYKESEDEDLEECLFPATKTLTKENRDGQCPETLEKPCPRKAKKAGGQGQKRKKNKNFKKNRKMQNSRRKQKKMNRKLKRQQRKGKVESA